MRTLTLLSLVSLLMLTGCMQFSMRFNATTELQSRYAQSAKDRNLSIYYNVKKSGAESVLQMAVQNTANVYMKNLTINYDDCCQNMGKATGTYNYKNLGNIKNRAHKTMTMTIPASEPKTVKLKYSYTPVREDGFLSKVSSSAAEIEPEAITSEMILYIK